MNKSKKLNLIGVVVFIIGIVIWVAGSSLTRGDSVDVADSSHTCPIGIGRHLPQRQIFIPESACGWDKSINTIAILFIGVGLVVVLVGVKARMRS